MSDTPPLRNFLKTVFAQIKAGAESDSDLAVWRNTARELVDRTLDVGATFLVGATADPPALD